MGERLGGQGEFLPPPAAGPARASPHWLRRLPAQRRGALEAGGNGRLRRRAGDRLDRRQLRRQLLRVGRAAAGPNAAGADRARSRARGGTRRRPQLLGRFTGLIGLSTLIQVTGFWPIFFLAVVLKIPVLASMWLVWWAAKQHDQPEAAAEDDGGFKQRPRPRLPRGPRRGGPHGGGAAVTPPPCPPGGRPRVVKPAAQPAFARGGSRAGKDGSQPRRYDA